MKQRSRGRRAIVAPLGALLVCLCLLPVLTGERGEEIAHPGTAAGPPDPRRLSVGDTPPGGTASPAVGRPSPAAPVGPVGAIPDPLARALAMGIPLRVRIADPEGAGEPEVLDLSVRPMRALADGFQVTVGADFNRKMATEPAVYEGWAFAPHSGARRGRATVAVVGDALAAAIRTDGGELTELRTDPATGGILALRLGPESASARCSLDESPDGTVATMASSVGPFADDDWLPAEIAPQWGTDPATGEITKYEQPVPNGEKYDLSLPDATVMIVLAKDATGSDSAANLTSLASTYLARMANVATIWENQLGIRLLVSELILTPDTTAYEDVGETLADFRAWGENRRPRSQFPRSVAARFGNLGFTGSVIGLAYLSTVKGSAGYGINKTNFNFTLVAHEMGHNFGTNHSSGGIMNSSYQSGQRDFFRDVTAGETAAKDIYDHVANLLFGPATLRHAEEIPFARDDFHTTQANAALVFDPRINDDASVRNGATNALTIAEVSRVYPIDAGTVELAGDSAVLFTPAEDFQGIAWFSYSLRGSIGNNGKGWLHRGDAAVLVGTNPNDATNLTLAPGESRVFVPPGSGASTVQTQASQARVDVTRDDNRFLILRANADAVGTDSFVVRRSSINYTIHITYAARPPASAPDVVFLEAGASSLRFSPMANDEGVGYRRPLPMGARIGVDGTSEDYFPNAFRLVGATNLNPEKGALALETTGTVREGANVAAPNGFLRFTPLAGANGVARIEYVIEDAAGNQTTETISVVLSFLQITSPVSAAVSIPPGVGLAIEGTTGSLGAGALSGFVAVDWEATGVPPGADATFSNSQNVNTTVRFSDPGTYVLRATASDNGYETSRELTVLVTGSAPVGGNLAPRVALTDSIVSAAAPLQLSEALPMVTDDGLPGPPAALATLWTHVAGPGPVGFAEPEIQAGIATFPFPGAYTLRLTADDGAVKTFDEVSIDYSGPGNGVPVTSGIADVAVPSNADAVIIDLFPVFEDGEDADADLLYSLEANTQPALFSTTTIDGDPERLTLNFAPDTLGSAHLTIRATDTDGFFVETTFTVTISNSAPSIAPIADQSIAEGQTLSFNVAASDPDNEGLTYSLVAGSPPGMTIDPASGALGWTPGESDGPGNFPVVVKVVDHSPAGLDATRYFRVAVAEVNEPPVIAPISDYPGFAQPDFTLTVAASDPDLPANSLRFFLDQKPPGASINAQSGVIQWTPASAGTYAFTVRVDDLGTPNLSDTETFSVEVVNVAPTMANQSFTIPENSPPGTEIGTVVANDSDGDGIAFSIAGGNPGGAFAIDPGSGRITVASSAPLDFEANNSLALIVGATDDAVPPLARLATITINLTNENEAPTLPAQTLQVAADEAIGAVIGTVAASDPEGDALTFAIVSGNEGGIFALDPQTAELRVAAQATLVEPALLTIQATDSGQPALAGSGSVTVIVTRNLVPSPAPARVLVPADNLLSSEWKSVAFDDSAWIAGQTGVGYERDSGFETFIGTDVEALMYNTTPSVWIRIPFTVTDPAAIEGLTLRMRYDDGYVAHLNGQEIARRNAPSGTPPWNAAASTNHDDALAIVFENVDVSAFAGALSTGDNVLAVHGLNDGATSSDMLIVPELVATGAGTIGLPTLPELATGSATSITTTGAVLRGNLVFNGGTDPEIFAVWGSTDGGTTAAQWHHSQSLGIVAEGPFSLPVGDLVANSPHFFRFYGVNAAGTAWSTPTGTFIASPMLWSTPLVATGANARVLVPVDATDGTAWRARDFDDSTWTAGPTGVGYERESGYQQLIGTDVEAAMFNRNATVFLRLPFHLPDRNSLAALTLRMKYDDAFVAFVNGTEIARSPNVPSTLAWNAQATASHADQAAVIFEDIDVLAAAAGSLVDGVNILAIHGLNAGSGSSDLLFVPELVASFPELSYAGWLRDFPQLEGDDRLPEGNPDGDDRNNFLEFAFGGDPTHPESEGSTGLFLPEFQRTVAPPTDDFIEVRFRRRIDHQALGLRYEAQSSTDLVADGWNDATTLTVDPPVPSGDGITEIVTLRILSDPGIPTPNPRDFFRIRVSRSP